MNASPLSIARIILLLAFGTASVAIACTVTPALFTIPEPRPGCDAPIRWKLGDVDSRFPLDRKTFLSTVFQAETVWERAIGRDLFLYDPEATFVVTTLFDDRQMMTYDNHELEKRLERYEEDKEPLTARYEALSASYGRDTAALEARISAFERDLRTYERTVAKVNASGGADPDLYEELEDERDDLDEARATIGDESDRLDAVAAEINGLVDRMNAETDALNEHIRSFRETYGDPQPFVQGLYDPAAPSITIYQFESREDLRLVLAHELGHALGIDEHVEDDPTAVMYFLMDGQDMENPSLTPGDIDAYSVRACPARSGTTRERIVRYLVETPEESLTARGMLAILGFPAT